MKKYVGLILVYSLLSFNLNCSSTFKPTSFKFSEKSFTIPGNVKELKNALGLKYFVYRGFRGIVDDYEVVVQLKDYPIWVSSENVQEDFYHDKSVVGITFIKPDKDFSYEKVKEEIEGQFKAKFSRNSTYDLLKSKQGLIVTINLKKEKYYISFYYGVNDKELSKYVSNVW